MNKRGFSIVELIVVITIIGILLTLVAISYRGYQANARDEQRQVRAENIARYLEAIYNTGVNTLSPPVDKGQYPPVQPIAISYSNDTVDEAELEKMFSKNGFDLTNLKSAGKDEYGFRVSTNYYEFTPSSGSMTVDEYIYEPLRFYDSSYRPTRRCYYSFHECRSFNLYYKTEVDDIVHKIKSAR